MMSANVTTGRDREPKAKGIIVQKYGGSSVADLERIGRVADKIVAARREGHPVVVVVSAMGKTTDALLSQAREVDPEPPRRELDMLVSTGERVSMALLSIAIQRRGCEAISFTGSQAGIITTDRHFDARIVAMRPFRVEEELERGRVVIVAGYQGVSERKEITTLGRGGSDTTAVALAAALRAERCEIYSDVDGVYSADPRVVPDARHLPEIDYDTLQTMAESGAKVLNAQAVEWAKRAGVEIHARHTGQRYEGSQPAEGSRQTVARAGALGAAAVSSEKGVVLARCTGDARSLDALAEVAREANVAPRDSFVDARGVTALFSLQNAPDWPRARRALEKRLSGELELRDDVATATVVGDGLTSLDGAFSPARLAEIARGAHAVHGAIVSPLRATLVTDASAVDALVRALHARLFGEQ
jgi:aspartate kinase